MNKLLDKTEEIEKSLDNNEFDSDNEFDNDSGEEIEEALDRNEFDSDSEKEIEELLNNNKSDSNSESDSDSEDGIDQLKSELSILIEKFQRLIDSSHSDLDYYYKNENCFYFKRN